MEIGETLYVTDPKNFRKWLEENHKSKKEIWLIQYAKDYRCRVLRYKVLTAPTEVQLDGDEQGARTQAGRRRKNDGSRAS